MTRIHSRIAHAARFRSFASASVALAVLLVPALPAAAQEPDKTTPKQTPTTTGPSEAPSGYAKGGGRFLVGDDAPDINLRDEDGKSYKLSEERKQLSQMVVFARHVTDVVEADRALAGLSGLGLGVVVIAPFHRDRVSKVAATPRVRMCHDSASVTARAYGVFDPVTTNPRSGAFLVSRKGKILLIMSGGVPTSSELVRMTREALEDAGERTKEEAGAGEG
jgi:peroxiredoxin